MPLRSLAGPALLALTLAGTGCSGVGVVRVLDGREVLGPYLSEQAYSAYATGEERAAQGDVEGALQAFRQAAREDDQSAAIWTKIGALGCRRAQGSTREATVDAFDRAEAIDPDFAPLWRERARCTRDGEPKEGPSTARLTSALDAAARATRLDPEDLEATTIHASILVLLHREADARRELEALALLHPTRAEALLALYELGRAMGDDALSRRAGARVIALAPALAPRIEGEVPSLGPLPAIDAALTRDDLSFAQRLARHAGVPLGEVALRAAALGRIAVARRQAETRAGADPRDLDAHIALAVAADLAGDQVTLDAALDATLDATRTGTHRSPADAALSPLGRLLFAEVLDRRVGPEAARIFLGPSAPIPPGDPLIEAVSRRVRARLDAASARSP